jgi:MFS family permease
LRPTRVRYLVVSLATLIAALLYLHRICWSFVERFVKEDLRLSDGQMAWLAGAFFLTYALGQVPAGWLSDRRGARLVLSVYIALWSLCTGLIGGAGAFAAILALRFGGGLAQAGAYPTSAALLTNWVPFRRRGLASSVVSNGGRLGGAVAPLLTAYLIVALVPANVSALLAPDDLLDARRLCVDLSRTQDTPSVRVGRSVLRLLPESARQVVGDLAAAPDTPVSDESRRVLAAGLNDVLRHRDLARPEDLQELPAEGEALKLGRQPRDGLSEAEVERLNRLLLEAAFPGRIKLLYGPGWRPLLLIYGAAGLLVAALFWLGFRNRPEQHPLCNAAEVRLIEADRPVGAPGPATGLPVGPILRSRSLWLCSATQFGTNFGWMFLFAWLPRYLLEVHHVPILVRGWMTALPLFFGMFGQLAGGWMTDSLTRSLGLRWGRCLPISLSRFVAMAAFALCPFLSAPWPVTAALTVVALATDFGVPAVWAYSQDVGGRHVGAVLGWGNMWGNFAAFLSPIVLDAIARRPGWGWPAVFVTCAAAFLFSGIAALGVDATIPLFPPERKAA